MIGYIYNPIEDSITVREFKGSNADMKNAYIEDHAITPFSEDKLSFAPLLGPGSAPGYSKIEIGSVTTGGAGLGLTGSIMWSHSIQPGSNKLLLVSVHQRDGQSQVSGVTYDGLTMTRAGSISNVGANNRLTIMRLLDPPAGIGSVEIILSGLTGERIFGGAITLSNAAQASPTTVFNTSGNGSVYTDISSNGSCLVIDWVAKITAVADEPYTPGPNQTVLFTGSNNTITALSSWQSGASTVTMSWAWGNVRASIHGVSNIIPANNPAAGESSSVRINEKGTILYKLDSDPPAVLAIGGRKAYNSVEISI